MSQPTDFSKWWNEKYRDVSTASVADYTYGEEVWNAAVKRTWQKVFDVISHSPQKVERAIIVELEGLRDDDGVGPLVKGAS